MPPLLILPRRPALQILPLCRGRTCAARNLTAKAILREGRGPGMPGPYSAITKKRVSAISADTLLNYVILNYIRLRYSSLISSTFVSRGLPGQQASAKADSAKN